MYQKRVKEIEETKQCYKCNATIKFNYEVATGRFNTGLFQVKDSSTNVANSVAFISSSELEVDVLCPECENLMRYRLEYSL